MKVVEASEVRKLLSMPVCIQLMKETLADLDKGTIVQPLRYITKFPQGEAFGFMPAYFGLQDYFGAKVLSAFPQNIGTEYPSHIGYVLLFESQHGSFVGMADATVITEIRTGAVSGVATDLLARKNSTKLGIIGAGAQGKSHLEAMCTVRPIQEVKVYDLSFDRAVSYATEMSRKHNIVVTAVQTPQEAVKEVDIVCTLTPSKEPYLTAEWIAPGTHVNAVGAFSPTTREICSDLVVASRLYADQIEAMRQECGEFLIPLQEGLIGADHIVGSLGSVLNKKTPGRQSEEEITLFDAVGLAAEDVACARYLCTK